MTIALYKEAKQYGCLYKRLQLTLNLAWFLSMYLSLPQEDDRKPFLT
jgi:hypothetical protein